MSHESPLRRPPPGYSISGDQTVQQIQVPPPTNLPPPPTFYPYPTERKRNRFCCCTSCYFCFCITLTLILLLILCLSTFFYAWYRPNLPGFTVESFELTNFNISETEHRRDHDSYDHHDNRRSTMSTRMTLEIAFTNANKDFRLVYEKICMAVVNDDTGLILGEVVSPGFTQGVNNVTTVKFVLKGNQMISVKDSIKLAGDFKDKTMRISLETSTAIGMITNNGWSLQPIWVKITCGGVILKELHNGKKPTCRAFVFNMHA